MKSKWKTFEESKKWVQSMNLRTKTEWEEFRKTGKKPKDIPTDPRLTYKNEWVSWGDWLRNGKKIERKGEYYSYEDAKKIVNLLNLKDVKEWRVYCKSGKAVGKIPRNPNQVYANNGWKNWMDWLGTESPSSRNRKFRSFDKARSFVHSLNLSSTKEWNQYCKSGSKPMDIPQSPARIYKKEWKSMGDWLGTGRVQDQKRVFRNFKDARKFAHSLNLKNAVQWQEFIKSKGIKDLPRRPDNTYENKGWKDWGDWLGTGNISNMKMGFLPFNEARNYVHSLKIESQKMWVKYCKSEKKPDNIPSNPNQVYKKEWKSMGDWLGTGRLGPKDLSDSFLSFSEAKTEVIRLAKKYNIKNHADWKEFVKSGNKPDNIPSAPWHTYSKKNFTKSKNHTN